MGVERGESSHSGNGSSVEPSESSRAAVASECSGVTLSMLFESERSARMFVISRQSLYVAMKCSVVSPTHLVVTACVNLNLAV